LPEALAASWREVVETGVTALRRAGVENPRLDSQLLLAEAAGVSRERLFMEDAVIDGATVRRFMELIGRREGREPIAYILGRKGFRRLTLAVDRRVLIPRPETELLVEVGLSLPRGARVVDVGTGSGAVALALKDERPDLEVWGTDVSAAALEVARANAARLRLDVRWEQADLLGDLTALGRAAEQFDAVLANLPYIEVGAELEPEITEYEPAAALFAGVDGLEAIRRLIPQLGEASVVALEVAFDQAAAAGELLHGAGWRRLEVLRDLGGHERVVVARR
jgi:release factor glutamine methyltransferase